MPNWVLSHDGFVPERETLREALTTLGNGFFCTRGAAEWADADDVHYPGTYLGGGYNRLVTEVAGRPVENEDLVNMPNWLCLTFRIGDGAWFDLSAVTLSHYAQDLNVREGVLTRTLRVTDAAGRETSLVSRRLVSMARPHLAGIEWSITPRNWDGRIQVRSAIDGRVVNGGVARYRDLERRHLEAVSAGPVGDDGVALVAETTQSRIRVSVAARTCVCRDGAPVEVERALVRDGDAYIAHHLDFDVREGETVHVEKLVALYTSRDRAISEPGIEARTAVRRGGRFAELLRDHRLAWEQLWRRCDIHLGSDPSTQLILRVHIFHLLQTVSRNTVDLDVGVPARGWHGEAYRGHIFWDEMFIFPFLNFNLPEITHALLLYRFRRLDEARAAAKAEGFRGAMFPWQSGSNGREETQTVHLNPKSGRWLPDMSHHQRHVNLAIAYNIWQYYTVTGNRGFMSVYGAEMLLEITRFWASIAHYNPDRDRYEIHGVMGPDEYHEKYPGAAEPGLRNNAYTNILVAWLMGVALKCLDELLDYRREEIRETLDLTDDEISLWADMAHKMYVPFDSAGIISQFEGYEDLKELDWEAYRARYGDIHRLDRILEAEGDNSDHYKLSKQADVLMLFYLFSHDTLAHLFERLRYPFDAGLVRRTVEYYAARTAHGSTLSHIVHSAVTALFDRTGSWAMFQAALRSDVEDLQGGTTPEGIHLGAMAGTVDLVQRCYMGVEFHDDDVLFLNPLLPDRLDDLAFNLRYRGMWLDVRLTTEKLVIFPRPGGPDMVKVGVRDRVYYLKAGYGREFPL